MNVEDLKEIAQRSDGGLSKQDDALLRAWIDEAFGTDAVRVDVARVGGMPELAVRAGAWGLVLEFGAVLRERGSGRAVGWFARRILVDAKVAIHSGMEIVHAYRDRGLGTALIARAVATYDVLGIERITLHAGYDLGRWHWARLGFEPIEDDEHDALLEHARSVVERLSLGLEIADEMLVQELAALNSATPVSLRQVSAASERFDRVNPVLDAAKNGIDVDAPIALGQAILLCGPSWSAELWLTGPFRTVFDEYVRRRLETTP